MEIQLAGFMHRKLPERVHGMRTFCEDVKLKVLEHGLDHEHSDTRKWVKTSVKKKTLDPVWNEKFVFEV